jgi:hypothetical protein
MTYDELLFEQAEKAMQEAADGVVEEARRTGGCVVVWENGEVRRLSGDQLPPPKKPLPKETEDRTEKINISPDSTQPSP